MHININKSAGQSIDLTEFGIGDEEVISLDINSTANQFLYTEYHRLSKVYNSDRTYLKA